MQTKAKFQIRARRGVRLKLSRTGTRRGESGRGQPHSTTLRDICCASQFREVVECGCPLPLSIKPGMTDAAPAEYKASELGQWKEGRPLDHVAKGNWWTVFGDQTLDRLEGEALAANQDLKAAMARVDEARSTARVARSELLPTLNFD